MTDPAVCRAGLVDFRLALYRCFGRRADALFELVDAVLTADGPVSSLVELSLEKVFRRGHGALYDAVASGEVDIAALTALITRTWEPADTGPVKIAIDVSAWPRPDAVTSEGLCHCYTACRCDGSRKTVPGWPFSFAAGLEWGASSWTAVLDAVRIGPDDDATVVTVAQIGAVVARLAQAGTLAGRPAPVFVFDSGYDLTRITHLAGAHGVQVLGRVRSDRVFYAPAPRRLRDGRPGRPKLHGNRFELSRPATLPAAEQTLVSHNRRYGTVTVSAWHGLHQKLTHQGAWKSHVATLPIVAGSVIRIQVERLPGNRAPQDLWLWHTAPAGTVFDLDLLWKTYLRRFDVEHTFRFLKSMLGWTAPQVRTPQQGERWTWLILAAHAQLRLARNLTNDLRRRWEKPLPADRAMPPGRVRRGFCTLRRQIGTPARTAKPTTAGPGRPKGTTRPPRTRYAIGKTRSTTDKQKPVKERLKG